MPIEMPRPSKAKKTGGTTPASSSGQGAEGTASGPPAEPTPAPAPTAPPASAANDRGLAIYRSDANNGDILEIQVTLIAPNPHNDRDPGDVSAEAAHIKKKGLLQPISVMRSATYLACWEEELSVSEDPEVRARLEAVRLAPWVILFGERRWLATQGAGKPRIDAILRDDLVPDSEEIVTSENLLRKNPTPLEEARQYHRFVNKKGMSYADIELVSGRAKGTISKRLALLTYSEALQTAVQEGIIGPTIAKEIADAVPDHASQAAVLRVMMATPPVHYVQAIESVLAGDVTLSDLIPSQAEPEVSLPAGAQAEGEGVSAGNGGAHSGSQPHGQTSNANASHALPPGTGDPDAAVSAGNAPQGASRQKALRKPGKDERDTAERRQAAADRTEICRALLKHASDLDIAPLVNSVFLTRFNQPAAHSTALGWLKSADLTGMDTEGAGAYFPAVLESGHHDLVQQAILAVALAGAENRAADQRRPGYDAHDRIYVAFLTSQGDYAPSTDWERAQLGLPNPETQLSTSPEGLAHV